jgi:coenzyme F420 hydrogenase subunit beta
VLDVHTGFALDQDLRFKASSGGVISALAQYILDSGEADYVVHVGADLQTPWLNDMKESSDHFGIGENAGSRYAPSAPLVKIVDRLRGPGRAVVIGKPCDIAGLRMYARENPLVDQKIAFMLAFVCGGVPSARGVEELLRAMGAAPEDVVSFRFRGYGWPGDACATLKNGEQKTLSYIETWGHTLSHHVQKRCKICPDGVGIFADIVCGDAWYGDERGYPKFEEQDGRSLIISRTPKGRRLVRAAEECGHIKLQQSSLAEVAKMQPSQVRRTQLTLSRILAMAMMGNPVPQYRGLHMIRAALQAGPFANLKSFLGALRRVLLGKL